MEGRRAVSPVGTASVEVEVMITSEGHGRLTLDGLCLVDGGAYQKRTAKVVALSSFVVTEPGPVWHRSYRDSVNETLASVDLVAEREHPDMMVLTENVFQTRTPSGSYYGNPNRLDGSDPDINALCERARRYHTYIVCSVHEKEADGIFRNTGLLIDREGKIAATYHKCHLTVGEIEGGMKPGEGLAVFDTDFARIGIQICWDQYFPESIRILAMQGAELICAPTHGSHVERAITRARENGVWLASAYTSREATLITAPGMEPLVDTGAERGYAVAEIDFNDPIRRRYLSCNSYGSSYEYDMCERRPELYGLIGTEVR
jgi:predicted amidohydrolase